VPRATAWSEEFSGDCAHADEPLGPQVIHNGAEVLGAAHSVRLDRSYCLLVADLLPLEGTCAIGVAELHTTSLGSGQSGLGALTDQSRFQFSN
jgi:hypothetical protein